MVQRAGHILVLLAGTMLLLPPSACCLLGAAICCGSGLAQEAAPSAPQKSCCQAREAKTCCAEQPTDEPSEDQVPQHNSIEMCCCSKPVAALTADAPSTELLVLNLLAVPQELPAITTQVKSTPRLIDSSPPPRVRFCVWQI
jgi:hypothetical protein